MKLESMSATIKRNTRRWVFEIEGGEVWAQLGIYDGKHYRFGPRYRGRSAETLTRGWFDPKVERIFADETGEPGILRVSQLDRNSLKVSVRFHRLEDIEAALMGDGN